MADFSPISVSPVTAAPPVGAGQVSWRSELASNVALIEGLEATIADQLRGLTAGVSPLGALGLQKDMAGVRVSTELLANVLASTRALLQKINANF